jgi:hypothetical protein
VKLGLAKRIACAERGQSQKQKMQWRSYVLEKLEEERIDKQNGRRAE